MATRKHKLKRRNTKRGGGLFSTWAGLTAATSGRPYALPQSAQSQSAQSAQRSIASRTQFDLMGPGGHPIEPTGSFAVNVANPVDSVWNRQMNPIPFARPKFDVCGYTNCGTIPRVNMPVINDKALQVEAEKKNIHVTNDTPIDFNDIAPLQSEINGNVVTSQIVSFGTKLMKARSESVDSYNKAVKDIYKMSGLEVSHDPITGKYYILDGHHGWAALTYLRKIGLLPKNVKRNARVYEAGPGMMLELASDTQLDVDANNLVDTKYERAWNGLATQKNEFDRYRTESNDRHLFDVTIPALTDIPFYDPSASPAVVRESETYRYTGPRGGTRTRGARKRYKKF